MSTLSPALLDEVAKHLPRGEPVSAREIYAGVGCWAYTTVRSALEDLVRQGRAESIERPIASGFKKLFRASESPPTVLPAALPPRIPGPEVSVTLHGALARRVITHAAERDITPVKLTFEIISTVINDGLVNAVLDN